MEEFELQKRTEADQTVQLPAIVLPQMLLEIPGRNSEDAPQSSRNVDFENLLRPQTFLSMRCFGRSGSYGWICRPLSLSAGWGWVPPSFHSFPWMGMGIGVCWVPMVVFKLPFLRPQNRCGPRTKWICASILFFVCFLPSVLDWTQPGLQTF